MKKRELTSSEKYYFLKGIQKTLRDTITEIKLSEDKEKLHERVLEELHKINRSLEKYYTK